VTEAVQLRLIHEMNGLEFSRTFKSQHLHDRTMYAVNRKVSHAPGDGVPFFRIRQSNAPCSCFAFSVALEL
jgi:hypothetical protein